MRLDLATALDRFPNSGGLTGKESVDIGFDPVQKRHVGNRPAFEASSQPGAELPGRKRFKKIQSAHHQLRLIKRATHIFAQRVVDSRYAAHSRVNLRQQRGRHLHKRHAAHVTDSSKTRHIADHTAA